MPARATASVHHRHPSPRATSALPAPRPPRPGPSPPPPAHHRHPSPRATSAPPWPSPTTTNVTPPSRSLQTVIDAGAAYGAFSWGTLLASSPDPFPGSGLLQALAYFLSGYFALSVLSDVFLFGGLSYAALAYGANAGAVLAAIQDVAGAEGGATGVGALDRAASAARLAKVVAALNEIADLLKAQQAAGGNGADSGNGGAAGTLKALSAMLTLARAEERGFDAAAYGLSREAAADLAAIFASYDRNDDFVLNPEELRGLW